MGKTWKKQYSPGKSWKYFFYFIGATLWAIFHGESEDPPVEAGRSPSKIQHFLVVAIAIEQCLAYICNQSSNKA